MSRLNRRSSSDWGSHNAIMSSTPNLSRSDASDPQVRLRPMNVHGLHRTGSESHQRLVANQVDVHRATAMLREEVAVSAIRWPVAEPFPMVALEWILSDPFASLDGSCRC